MQTDSANSSTAAAWNELLNSKEMAPSKQAVKERQADAFKPFFYVANILDKISQGQYLELLTHMSIIFK